jgi:hypothetical protein
MSWLRLTGSLLPRTGAGSGSVTAGRTAHNQRLPAPRLPALRPKRPLSVETVLAGTLRGGLL